MSNDIRISRRDDTEDAPYLAKRNLSGLGQRQRLFLDWLAEQAFFNGGDVPYLDAWLWMGEWTGYLYGSQASQARMKPFIGQSLYGLLQTLVKRNIILVLPGEDNPDHKMIRLLVEWN